MDWMLKVAIENHHPDKINQPDYTIPIPRREHQKLEVKIPGTMVTSASGIVTSHADKYWIPLSGEEYHYNDTATQPVNQILYVVTVASMGNSNNITASTLVGIPKQIVSSGINFNFNAKLHYRDI